MMKKTIFTLLLLAFYNITLIAQPVATTGSIEYQKGYKSSAVIELPYSTEVVEKSIKENFLKKGIKEEKIKGFQAFKGARLTPTDGEVADLYFKVERKSRKEPNVSVVHMIVGRPNENVSLRTSADEYRISEAKTFLNDMTPSVDAYNLEVDIAAQEEVVKKSEKKFKNLEDDQADLEKKIKNLQEKLAQNKRDQEAQNAEMIKQRSVRDAMHTRRSAPSATSAKP